MKDWVISYLRCPCCLSTLGQHVFEEQHGEIETGVVVCQEVSCASWYPIIRSVPRMLPSELRSELPYVKQFEQTHQKTLLQLDLLEQATPMNADELAELKEHTITNFGFEWNEYARFGWDDEVYNTAFEEGVFRYKSLLKPEEIDGKLVLDAGCGNGRYSRWAAEYGGRVIGVDLSTAVEAAVQNLKQNPNVQIVQGDIFNLPFVPACFDLIFSIGVLMHTGDAHRATQSLMTKLKPNGKITVHLYGKGNPVYEFMDRTLREKTTRMSIEELQTFTKRAYRLRRWLEKARLAKLVAGRYVRLDKHPHCIFDWYSAPIATHHTYDEVKAWMEDAGFEITDTNESPDKTGLVKLLQPLYKGPGTVTVQGQSKEMPA